MTQRYATCVFIALTTLVSAPPVDNACAQYYAKALYGPDVSTLFGDDISGNYDLNGDGIKDLVVAAPNALQGKGVVKIYSGAGTLLMTLQGNAAGDRFGSSVAIPGDLNGDGHPDILVGATGSNNCTVGTGTAGYVKALLGPAFTTSYFTVSGNAADQFGAKVRVIGDINNDGIGDFIVGQPNSARQSSHACSLARGGAKVFSGSSGAQLYSYTGTDYGDRFGFVVGATGDVNADGKPDFAAYNGIIVNSAKTSVYSGSNGVLLYSVGVSGGNGAIEPLADINSDGKADFLVGTSVGVNPSYKGAVVAVSGVNGSVIYTKTGDTTNDRFGVAVASLQQDVNNDGTPDFVAGSDDENNPSGAIVKLCSGSSGNTLYTFNNSLPGTTDQYGRSLASLGDINQDGFNDFAVGAPVFTKGIQFQGAVFIYYGPNGLPKPPWQTGGDYRIMKPNPTPSATMTPIVITNF